jgi:hypothetical protein
LKHTKEKIARHIKEFEMEVKLLDRKTVRKQNVEIIKSLNAPLKTLESSRKITNGSRNEVDFPVSSVAMYRNYTFVGRETNLEQMTNFLLPPQEASDPSDADQPLESGEPRCCILHGIGGVGKTQTALEYSYAYRNKYDAVFWLPAERDIELRGAFGAIAEKLQLVPKDKGQDDEPKEKIEVARKWLENTGKFSRRID